jgi:branched-chain amino acid transport system ATP-binding protein
MLEIESLVANYGGITALHGVSISVPVGGIVTLIGSNGAGKSTVLRAVSGLLRSTAGRLTLDGRHDIRRMRPDQIVQAGVAHVPEGRQVFADLTVHENLALGAYTRRDTQRIRGDFDAMFARFPVLGERPEQPAGTLSGGEQQMLAIARALMARPKLLLLDEPSLGLAPLIVEVIFEAIRKINREDGVTVLVVEQDVGVALEVADYGYVLIEGRVALEGSAKELMRDPRVKRAYLGY